MPKSRKSRKPKKTKEAIKRQQKRKMVKQLMQPVNIPAALDAPETRWIVPLIATHIKTQKRYACGTAFFIAGNILLTAWHNIPDLIGEIAENPDLARDSYQWSPSEVLDFMTISVLQMIDGQYGLQRRIRHIHRCRFSDDIALLHLWPDENVPADTPLEYAPLEANPPVIGERVRAFGYTDSIATDGLVAGNLLELGHDPRLAVGNVEQIHEPRRDTVLLPFPCFAVKANFVGGMSGGPVSNEQGRVCGVVSKGMDGGKPPISYAASLWPILGERIQWDEFNGGQPFLFMDLVSRNLPNRNSPYVYMSNWQNYQLGIDETTRLPVQVRRRPAGSQMSEIQ